MQLGSEASTRNQLALISGNPSFGLGPTPQGPWAVTSIKALHRMAVVTAILLVTSLIIAPNLQVDPRPLPYYPL